ncbi:hypothetical protein PJL18_00654 [Paenarthrobacter nicotinovorans]|nr:hypothetical protein [Paenarthrobacter nicotinovorans]
MPSRLSRAASLAGRENGVDLTSGAASLSFFKPAASTVICVWLANSLTAPVSSR